MMNCQEMHYISWHHKKENNLKKLPIGIQSFSKIIKNDYLYVDKTRDIVELMQAGEYLFL